MNQSEES